MLEYYCLLSKTLLNVMIDSTETLSGTNPYNYGSLNRLLNKSNHWHMQSRRGVLTLAGLASAHVNLPEPNAYIPAHMFIFSCADQQGAQLYTWCHPDPVLDKRLLSMAG